MDVASFDFSVKDIDRCVKEVQKCIDTVNKNLNNPNNGDTNNNKENGQTREATHSRVINEGMKEDSEDNDIIVGNENSTTTTNTQSDMALAPDDEFNKLKGITNSILISIFYSPPQSFGTSHLISNITISCIDRVEAIYQQN